jgi:glycosyltransferase involved in cell wall biosynthesis
MNIGFDAKRYFHNATGLGNYSRTLIEGLVCFYPEHQYFLFNPKEGHFYKKYPAANVHEVLPGSWLAKKLSSAWRSSWVKNDLERFGIDLYHGLSHEIPIGIQKRGIPSVVTIHDLIFERYPEQFTKIDVRIYHQKFSYACRHADRIIAISKQTKQDIIDWYGIPEGKIDICYQSCNPVFATSIDEGIKEDIRQKYKLPQQFFLSVGSIIERKNLLGICKAMALVRDKIHIPLVVIGDGGAYKQEVKRFVRDKRLEKQVLFLSEQPEVKNDNSFQSAATFAAIYQMAKAMIYPSFFEGFGIPVLEALWSKLPVITSSTSCLPETGGNGAYYVDPHSEEEIAGAMLSIINDSSLKEEHIEKGWQHAQRFTLEKCTSSVMVVYKKLIHAEKL